MQFLQRTHTGAVACVVGGICAIQQKRIAVGQRPRGKRAEERRLAVIAAVGGICRDGLVFEHVQLQHGQRYAELRTEALRVVQLELRLKGRLYIIRMNVRTCLHTGIEQVRRVHAAGKAQRGLRIFFEECQ